MSNEHAVFTREMKQTHTILIPTMLPIHFSLIAAILRAQGYHVALLDADDTRAADIGLRHVHNDTCYPAILVVGQFLGALEQGLYDPERTALMLFQTGGGCRASNYIPLLRKAPAGAGLSQVPVVSFSPAGVERHPGFAPSLPMLYRMLFAVLYADLLCLLSRQCMPYELHSGDTQYTVDGWTTRLSTELAKGAFPRLSRVRETCRAILHDFSAIPRHRRDKPRVGIVGEIFVKYSPLGNNHLEDFLLKEGAEVAVPGLLDFFLYSTYNDVVDRRLYGTKPFRSCRNAIAVSFLSARQKELIDLIQKESDFTPPTSFAHVRTLASGIIGLGAKMGEGWLLAAEMVELAESGVRNIVCAQPFGCLPNHICGKGMMQPIKQRIPSLNIVAIDYDASATRINQENRIKLMLASAMRA